VQVCLALDRATFENNCVKINTDKHILSVVDIFGRDCSFWQCKVCADICADSLENRRQRTVGSRVNGRHEHFFLACENNCVKLNTDKPTLYQLPYSSESPCSLGILVSSGMKFMRTFAGVI